MKPANDHFSPLAGNYAQFRPGYPKQLFELIARLAPSRDCVWDCATGSGQAAVALAPHFARVVATDGSAAQIASAQSHEKIDYRVASAESSGLPDRSVDAVTVAQALHWFEFDRFYAEVKRVLRPGGIIAVWSYDLFTVNSRVDPIVNDFYERLVHPYWPAERRHVETGYRDIPFPFESLQTPHFEMSAGWELARMLGYLRTWSATKRYREANGRDPVDLIAQELSAAWGESGTHLTVTWPLSLRIGRL